MTRRSRAAWAGVVLALAWGCAPGADPRVERGRYLVDVAGCVGCHTDLEGEGPPLAGGRRLETRFGVFFGPNITPHAEHGIGGWSDREFLRALTEGIAPEGHYYYPVFPYTSYTRMRREDALAIKAYLFSLPAVERPNRPHEPALAARWRPALALWRWLSFEPGTFEPDPRFSPQWNRGAYLAALGHCVECHTPRNLLGGLDRRRLYAGTADGPEGETVPNITAHPEAGIGGWDRDELVDLLRYGELPDGDYVGGSMAEVVDASSSRLTDADLEALIVYLLSLPPVGHRPGDQGDK